MKVWIVDDNAVFRTLVKMQISKIEKNITVEEFEHGKSAMGAVLKYDSDNQPDIILLDINMPVMNGWEFISAYDKLDVNFDRTWIYIVTSSIDPKDFERARDSEYVHDFLVKPIEIDNLKKIFTKVNSSRT